MLIRTSSSDCQIAEVVNFENALENQAILDQKSVSKLKFLTESKKIPEVGT